MNTKSKYSKHSFSIENILAKHKPLKFSGFYDQHQPKTNDNRNTLLVPIQHQNEHSKSANERKFIVSNFK